MGFSEAGWPIIGKRGDAAFMKNMRSLPVAATFADRRGKSADVPTSTSKNFLAVLQVEEVQGAFASREDLKTSEVCLGASKSWSHPKDFRSLRFLKRS